MDEHGSPKPRGRLETGETKFYFTRSRAIGTLALRNVQTPANIQLIGNEVAIVWNDGAESYFAMEELRAASPSAQNVGERDILGNQYGGDGPKHFPGVMVLGWEIVGNYAIRFEFSDGHRTGLYSYDYLRTLAERHR